MITGHRPVSTLQMPEVVAGKAERAFLREMETHMKESRPQVVVDCSGVRQFDKCALRLLLHTLEHALKRKGDVRLAGVPVEARNLMESTGATRLFEIYNSTAEAVDSFHQIPAFAMSGHAAAAQMA
jgi:anti-anti-sigma factor